MPRGSKPGERRGGRQAGTPNKSKQAIEEKLAALGCDPIEGMALIALDPKNSPELRGKMFSELAQYVSAKRKAVEHSGPDGGPMNLQLVEALSRGRERVAKSNECSGQSG